MRAYVMVKPDAALRRLLGHIIDRYEREGLKLVGRKLQTVSRELAERHYAEHRYEPFYGELLNFLIYGPSVAISLGRPEGGGSRVALVRDAG